MQDNNDKLPVVVICSSPLLTEANERWRNIIESIGNPVDTIPRHRQSPIVLITSVDQIGLPGICSELSDRGSRSLFVIFVGESFPRLADLWLLLEAGATDTFHDTGRDDDNCIAAVTSHVARHLSVTMIAESSMMKNHCIGQSSRWLRTMREVIEVARFSRTSILLTGESGTGKEVVARMIHELDSRTPKGGFEIVDCTTLARELSRSDLFGHVRGAFTGAHADRDGAFSNGDGGTIFFDEIGDLPAEIQAELLRVIQEKTFKRVGGTQWERTEFRLICATHRDLHLAVRDGRFRHDLFHRISGSEITLPPLRNRPEDVLPLVDYFLEEYFSALSAPKLSPALSDYLQSLEFPGNIRQLRNLVHRMALRFPGKGMLSIGVLPPEYRAKSNDSFGFEWRKQFRLLLRQALMSGASLKDIGRWAESDVVDLAIEEAEGNLQRAARRLQITDRALQMRVAARRKDNDSIKQLQVERSS